ncbi:hypothetical protein JOQ06_017546, partial [Pogonophryne albipinna]
SRVTRHDRAEAPSRGQQTETERDRYGERWRGKRRETKPEKDREEVQKHKHRCHSDVSPLAPVSACLSARRARERGKENKSCKGLRKRNGGTTRSMDTNRISRMNGSPSAACAGNSSLTLKSPIEVWIGEITIFVPGSLRVQQH